MGKNAKQVSTSVTHDCERDVQATMPRAASCADIGRRLLAARGIPPFVACTSRSQLRSHVYLFCVLSHGFRYGMRGAAHTRNVFNTEKPFLSSSHTWIYLVHIIQPNSPLSLMLSFFYLHYNVIQRECRASWLRFLWYPEWSRSRQVKPITLTETLIISDVTKTESNNCFKENNDKRIIAPNTVYFRQAMFLLRCPRTWHCSWKSCMARATYRLFTNLLAD